MNTLHARRLLSQVRLCLLMLGALCALAVAKPAKADGWHYGVIWGADYVDMSHPGYHTHANTIGFDLRRLYMPHASSVQVKPHSYLATFSYPYGSIENWGAPISGDYVFVSVPSQFADFVLGLYWFAPYTAWQYWSEWNYRLEVRWYGP